MIHHRESLSTSEEQRKDISISFNAKNKIHIRSEDLLTVTLTKTSIDLGQRLSEMFSDAYKNDLPKKDDSDEEAILSLHNMTGYDILIDNITGVEVSLDFSILKMTILMKFADNTQSEILLNLKHKESIALTVSDEQLSATHLPTIAKSIGKRRQEFSVKVNRFDFESSLF